jgi:pilus assembly protein CpaB
MKGKAIIPLALGLCIGLVAIKFVVDTVKKAQATGTPKETITVVRAASDINVGEEFLPELLEEVDVVPNGLVPANERVNSMADLKDRVAAKTIPQGAAVLRTMLAPEGTKPGMVARVPQGYRAFSVPITETSAVAFQFKPGDWVDVIVVMDIKSAGRKTETISEVILQNIQVIAVGRSQSSRATTGDEKAKAAKSATLLVPESEVPKLHLARTRGTIALALRGDDGVTTPANANARLTELFTSVAMDLGEEPEADPAPAPQIQVVRAKEPEPYAVTIYAGVSGRPGVRVERLTFENEQSRRLLDSRKGPISGSRSLMAGRTSAWPVAVSGSPAGGTDPSQTTTNADEPTVWNEDEPIASNEDEPIGGIEDQPTIGNED